MKKILILFMCIKVFGELGITITRPIYDTQVKREWVIYETSSKKNQTAWVDELQSVACYKVITEWGNERMEEFSQTHRLHGKR